MAEAISISSQLVTIRRSLFIVSQQWIVLRPIEASQHLGF
jgi:hypothetical protein